MFINTSAIKEILINNSSRKKNYGKISQYYLSLKIMCAIHSIETYSLVKELEKEN